MGVYTEGVKLYPIIIDLVACLCEEIAARALPPVCRCAPMPGNSPVLDFGPSDTAKGNGQAWVRYAGHAPAAIAEGGGGGVFNITPCAGERVYELEVGISRCEPAGIQRANSFTPPTLEEQLEAVRLAQADLEAMEAAVCCLRKKLGSDELVIGVGVSQPLESTGGVGGTTLQVFVQRA